MRKAAEDPFREHEPARLRARLHVLGGVFTVESGDAELLDLAVEAFGGMPKHRLERKPHHFTVRLVRTAHPKTWRNSPAPPPPVLSAGAGLLCATVDAGSFAVVDVPMSRALICVSNAMLRHRYHARYELVELVFLTLAARAQSLVPLHAACVGHKRQRRAAHGRQRDGQEHAEPARTGRWHAARSRRTVRSSRSRACGRRASRTTCTSAPQALRYLKSKESAASYRAFATDRATQRGAQVRVRSARSRGQESLAPACDSPRRFSCRGDPRVGSRRFDRSTARACSRGCGASSPTRRLSQIGATFEQRIADLPAYELRRTEHPDAAVRQLQLLL